MSVYILVIVAWNAISFSPPVDIETCQAMQKFVETNKPVHAKCVEVVRRAK